MSSYLAWDGSCWARADRTGKKGTRTQACTHARTHTPMHWQIHLWTQTHRILFMHACKDTQTHHTHTCLHLTSSQRDNPDGFLVTAVTRERERGRESLCGAQTPDDSRLLTSSFIVCVCVCFVPQTSHRSNNMLKWRISRADAIWRLGQLISVWTGVMHADAGD